MKFGIKTQIKNLTNNSKPVKILLKPFVWVSIDVCTAAPAALMKIPSLPETSILLIKMGIKIIKNTPIAGIIVLIEFFVNLFCTRKIIVIAKKKKISNQKAEVELLKEKQPSLLFIQKNDVASLVYYLSTDVANQITGSSIPIDGAWTSQ